MWLNTTAIAEVNSSNEATSALSKALINNATSILQNSASAQGETTPSPTTSSVQQQTQQTQNAQNSFLWQGGSILVGGAALGAVFVELLKKFGNTAIDSRQIRLTQELQAEKNEKQFYLEEAGRDSKTINDTLHLFITKHLDTTTQYQDLYYLLLEEYKALRTELQKSKEKENEKTEELRIVKNTLKDVLAVLELKSRQNRQE